MIASFPSIFDIESFHPLRTEPLESSTSSFVEEKQLEKEEPMATATDIEAAKEAEKPWKPQKAEWMIMITLATCSLMVALDATILVSVLPTLAIKLHGTANEALWAGTSYLLTSAVFQPFIAALSDIFGRRELLIPSLLFFTTGSIICAVSHTFTELLAGRCVQGIGAGGIITLSQVVFADIIPLRQRPKYFSVVLGAWALGTLLGPLVGGLFVEKATWRWCFYLNLPLCGVGLILVPIFVRLKTEKSSLKARLLRVDWLGGFLFIASLTSFLISISWGGIQFAWMSSRTLVPLIAGVVGLAAALLWERYGAPEPFLRKSLFHQVSAVAAYFCAMIQGLLLFCALYYCPFYLTSVHFDSAVRSGVLLFPATCFVVPGSVVVSQLITRLGHFRWAVWGGFAVSTVGAGLFSMFDEHTSTVVWSVCVGMFGLGMGMVLSSVNFAVQANAKIRDAGRAAAMYAFMRSLGMAFGVAIEGSVFQNLMAAKLEELHLPSEIARDAEAYVAVLRTLTLSDPTRAGVLAAYVHGFRGVFEVMTVLCGAGLLLAFLIKHRAMDVRIESTYAIDRTSRSSKLYEVAMGGQSIRTSRLFDGSTLDAPSERSSKNIETGAAMSASAVDETS